MNIPKQQIKTENFINKAKSIHGDKYNYDKTIYVRASDNLTITCLIHGDFSIRYDHHLNRQGCRLCAIENQKFTLQEFIDKANIQHNNKYNYSLSIYIGSNKKLKIICPLHGLFKQTPSEHLKAKDGCRYCSKNKYDQAMFLEKAISIHGDKYDYSISKYKGQKKKVDIICKEHGKFTIRVAELFSRKGCQKCSGSILDTEIFIKRATEAHNGRYDYSLVDYKPGTNEKIIIICKEHGEFEQLPRNHLHMVQDCPKCKRNSSKVEKEWLNYLGIDSKYWQKIIRLEESHYRVDAYVPEANTIYEFNGDIWHGNPNVLNPNDINPYSKKSYKELYDKTVEKESNLIKLGYKIISIWENDWNKIKKSIQK